MLGLPRACKGPVTSRVCVCVGVWMGLLMRGDLESVAQ